MCCVQYKTPPLGGNLAHTRTVDHECCCTAASPAVSPYTPKHKQTQKTTVTYVELSNNNTGHGDCHASASQAASNMCGEQECTNISVQYMSWLYYIILPGVENI